MIEASVTRPPSGIAWRPYVPGRDAAPLAALFRAAVIALAAPHYDAAQRAAWASGADDLAAFDARLARGTTLVADCAGASVAFGQLFPADHVEMLYVAPAWVRHGLASALLARLEACARGEGASVLRTEASVLARPVFERAGFSLVAMEVVGRGGVSLPRFQMAKPLRAANLSG
ncbi:GNAT family N-acetyltransferase [Paraburkholderia ferrariae]|uniref:GNAT family N-acetyltransferase n=1 Tax=Paraburkholderia ferrariae TaxID=386056 RepID=UPI0005A6AAC4|nr:GNAT family N-acetyltransferase [Paraburkholderia ferrariae]